MKTTDANYNDLLNDIVGLIRSLPPDVLKLMEEEDFDGLEEELEDDKETQRIENKKGHPRVP